MVWDRAFSGATMADPLDQYGRRRPTHGPLEQYRPRFETGGVTTPPPNEPRKPQGPVFNTEFHGTPSEPPSQPGPQAPFRGGDSWIDRTFLGVLRRLEPYGGTPARWFNQAVQQGRRAPFTEADLTPGDDAALRMIVEAHSRANQGARQGLINPSHYGASRSPNAQPLRNALGSFGYTIADDGSIKIRDLYDFNVNRGPMAHEMSVPGKLMSIGLGPVTHGANIGRSVIGSDTDRGIPVNITLPPLVRFEDYPHSAERPANPNPPLAGFSAPNLYGALQLLGLGSEGLRAGVTTARGVGAAASGEVE